jgi:dienelactone hydrolase
MFKKIAASISLLLFIVTCSIPSLENNMKRLGSDQIEGQDYRTPGKFNYAYTKNSLKSASGCQVEYTEFVPEASDKKTAVILGHGFTRNQKTQKDMAEHLASWGIYNITVDFCNSRPWNGHHDKNGADMVLIANAVGAESIVYSGFSAGGLAAFIASSLDSRTRAYLGLDMVDNFKKGIKAAPKVEAPVFGLIAESSMCNAKNNGFKVYKEIEQSNLLRVRGASHCDFEYPFDRKCTYVCGGNKTPYSREDIQENILGLTTALFLWQTGIDVDARNWWEKESLNAQQFIETNRIIYLEN